MYTFSSHELVLTDVTEAGTPFTSYVLNDRELSPEEEQEMHMHYAKQLFDDMWHSLLALHRPLSLKEYKQYQDLFTGVLDIHQEYHLHRYDPKNRKNILDHDIEKDS